MLQDSLIICYSTPNYEKLTTHFLKCLENIYIPSKNICMKYDIPPTELMNKTGVRSNLWYYCLITKLKHLIDSLQLHNGKYDYYISSDCDVQFLQNNVEKWSELELYIKENDKDIYFMNEKNTKDVNGGFYIICNKNLDKTIAFLTDIYNEMIITPFEKMPFGEQTLINNKRHLLNYGMIPNKYVIWSRTIYDNKSSLIHHAVNTNDINDKWEQITEIIRYFKYVTDS